MQVFEGIGINKKECDICYWYFIDKAFNFQLYVCNNCHDVLTMSVNFNNIAILNINRANLYCSINGDSKSDAVNSLQNANLTKEKGVLQKFKN